MRSLIRHPLHRAYRGLPFLNGSTWSGWFRISKNTLVVVRHTIVIGAAAFGMKSANCFDQMTNDRATFVGSGAGKPSASQARFIASMMALALSTNVPSQSNTTNRRGGSLGTAFFLECSNKFCEGGFLHTASRMNQTRIHLEAQLTEILFASPLLERILKFAPEAVYPIGTYVRAASRKPYGMP